MPATAPPDLGAIAEMPDEDLEDIVAAIHDGANSPADALGFGEDALNAVEQMALGFYRGKLYGKAAVVYGFVLRMSSTRATAWRGLAACCQALQGYRLAVRCYEAALEQDPGDLVSRVHLGECCCLLGDAPKGLRLLEQVVASGSTRASYLPCVTRARAIVGAGGGTPSRLVLMRTGKKLATEGAEATAFGEPATAPARSSSCGSAGAGATLDETREITAEDMRNNPGLHELIRELAAAVGEGRLTLAEVGGFTSAELDGAYACACKYADMGQLVRAIEIAGHLVYVDPYGARYYQLMGICLHRMKQYDLADHFYALATTLEPDNVMTLVYRGETKIMSGDTDAGLRLVRRGVAAAAGKPSVTQVVQRGRELVRRFGG